MPAAVVVLEFVDRLFSTSRQLSECQCWTIWRRLGKGQTTTGWLTGWIWKLADDHGLLIWARPLSLHNLVSPISGLPTHLYQAHLYRAHLYQTSFLPSSKYGRTHSGKLALTGDPGAGAPTHDFCLRQKSFGLFSIVPGPPW